MAIRTDASIDIGTGHVMRCLTLADALRREGFDVTFLCRTEPGHALDLIRQQGFGAKALGSAAPGWETDAAAVRAALDAYAPVDWLVVDHYGLDRRWESALRPLARRILAIDDLADRVHDCDVLLDQNYYHDLELRYRGLVPEHCVTLLGPAHVLLRPEFAEARKKDRPRDGSVSRMLVFFGGADQANQTRTMLEALKLLQLRDIEVDVVVGLANPHQDAIRAMCGKLPNVAYHCQVSNMAELILKADLGVGAGGSAMWERCYLGLPTITVTVAANQIRTTEDVAKIGAAEYLGWFGELGPADYVRAISGMLGDREKVRRIADAALRVVRPDAISIADMMRRCGA